MVSFEECIQQRFDIAAYQPESEEEIRELIRILGENHKIIHSCASDAGLKVSQYHSFTETELKDVLRVLQEGDFYALSSPERQEILKREVEGTLRNGDWAHLSPYDYSDGAIIAFGAAAGATGGILLATAIAETAFAETAIGVVIVMGGTFGLGALLFGIPLAALYVYLRE